MPPVRSTVPPVGLDTAVTVGVVPSTSVSLPNTLMTGLAVESSATVAVSSTATGASLTGVTVTDTVPVSVRVPSETV